MNDWKPYRGDWTKAMRWLVDKAREGEREWAVTERDGRLWYLKGESDRVHVSGDVAGLLVAHNHPPVPDREYDERGLSHGDVIAAAQQNLSAIVAVCGDGKAYICRRPAGGWPSSLVNGMQWITLADWRGHADPSHTNWNTGPFTCPCGNKLELEIMEVE